MPLLIGMDEAGYGPNLGPLVVTAVAWEVPGDPRRCDLWNKFADVVSEQPCDGGLRVQIADSKRVYNPSRGLSALETGVLTALGVWRATAGVAAGRRADALCATPSGNGESLGNEVETAAACEIPASLIGLLADVSVGNRLCRDSVEPWADETDLPLPHAIAEVADLYRGIQAWRHACEAAGIRLRAISADVVAPQRFNSETRRHDSKGRALSKISMNVLAGVWQQANGDADRALIIADKHGGRNRYHEFLPLVFADRFIRCREEGLNCSRYQVGSAEIRFETRSERHLPVALASMVSKYIRELTMVLFNRFWLSRIPGLRPTAGYPGDASRFRTEIAGLQRELRISDDVLWRER